SSRCGGVGVRYPAPVATVVAWPQFIGAEDLLAQPSHSTHDLGDEVIPPAPDGTRAPVGESEEERRQRFSDTAIPLLDTIYAGARRRRPPGPGGRVGGGAPPALLRHGHPAAGHDLRRRPAPDPEPGRRRGP